MKNSTMLIRAVLVITILTSVPHVFAALGSPSSDREKHYAKDKYQTGENLLIGEWRATYDELNGSVICRIKQENKQITGRLTSLVDEGGNSYADNTLVLEVIDFGQQRQSQIQYGV